MLTSLRNYEKLRKHGIAGKVLGVIENWLKGRRQGVYKREMVKLDHSLEWSASGFSTRSTVIFDLYLSQEGILVGISKRE